MSNVKSIITKHNAHIARKDKAQGKGTVNCSCSKNAICPLQKQCMTKDIVYKATVTTSNPNTIMNYIGMTSTTFKERWLTITILSSIKSTQTKLNFRNIFGH